MQPLLAMICSRCLRFTYAVEVYAATCLENGLLSLGGSGVILAVAIPFAMKFLLVAHILCDFPCAFKN